MKILRTLLIVIVASLAGQGLATASASDLSGWSCALDTSSFDPTVGTWTFVDGVCLTDTQVAQSKTFVFNVTSSSGNSCGWTARGTLSDDSHNDTFTITVSDASATIALGSGGSGSLVPDPQTFSRRCLVADAGGPAPVGFTGAFGQAPGPPAADPASNDVCAATANADFGTSDPWFSFYGTATCKHLLTAATAVPVTGGGSYTGAACTPQVWNGTFTVGSVTRPIHIVFKGTLGTVFSNGRLLGVASLPLAGTTLCNGLLIRNQLLLVFDA